VLQLQTKNIDICRISKLLVRYNIKASITDQVITLEGEISDELLSQLCGDINIYSVQNFTSEETQLNVHEEITLSESEELMQLEPVKEMEEIVEQIQTVEENIENETVEEPVPDETVEEVKVTPNIKEYELLYPVVKRGQAYWCDLEYDDPECVEHHKIRPVIIISNDEMNSNKNHRNVTILPCSTKTKYYPYNYHFKFTDEIMIEKVDNKVDYSFTNADGHCIQTVDKKMLREYIGTMNSEFMEKMQDIIDSALSLKRKVKTIVKEEKVQFNRSVPNKRTVAKTEVPPKRPDANLIEEQLLSFVDINELNQISQSKSSISSKTEEMLKLFGFNLERNGVQYLRQAIIYSVKYLYFNIETLSQEVSRKTGIHKEEVIRLIVARVKERFGFKKAPTIDFIRLINSFLLKQEEEK